MPQIHSIRLRGPWNLEPIARFVVAADGSLATSQVEFPPAARMTMPADWSAAFGANFLGLVRYHRVFQTPTGLENGERVFLVIEPPRSRGEVKLSDRLLGVVEHGGPFGRFEITDQLQDHNRLEVIVEHPVHDDAGRAPADIKSPGGLIGEIRLEIEEVVSVSDAD